MRAGIGFDAHAFADGRPLVLGGVTVPGARGLAGHSDADVLCHAIGDAILGAAALGDLGEHFPSSDPRWEGARSTDLLAEVARLLGAAGFAVASIDATVVLESPPIARYRAEMTSNVATALGVAPAVLSIKATTTDGLGMIGRGEGAAALAIALLEERG